MPTQATFIGGPRDLERIVLPDEPPFIDVPVLVGDPTALAQEPPMRRFVGYSVARYRRYAVPVFGVRTLIYTFDGYR